MRSTNLKLINSSTANDFWASIEDIQGRLALSNEDLSDFLEINNFIQHKNRKRVTLDILESVLSAFNISAQNFLLRTYDIDDIYRKYHSNEPDSIPNKYTQYAFSNFFTLQNITEQAKKYGLRSELLRHLQMNESVLSDPLKPVSALAVNDAFSFLSPYLSNQDYDILGFRNAFYLKESSFGETLSHAKSFKEVFINFIEVVAHLEQNWTYEVKNLKDNKVTLISKPSERILEHFEGLRFSNVEVLKFRMSVVSYLPQYIGLNKSSVYLKKSIFFGDSYCEVDIENN